MAKKSKSLAIRESGSRKVSTDIAGASNPYMDSAEELMGGDGNFLRFSGKSGKFTVGMEKEEVELGTRFAVNGSSFEKGWVCWVDDEIEEEIMKNILSGEPLPSKKSLEDYGPYEDGDGWKKQSSVDLRDITTGEQMTFTVSSGSGVNAIGKLIKEYGQEIARGMDQEEEVLIVEIDTEEFTSKVKADGKKKAKEYTNFKPIFTVVGCADISDLKEMFGEASGDDPKDYEDEDEDENDTDIDDGNNEEAEEEEETPKKRRKLTSRRSRADKYSD